jgi:phosphate-selective porin OprO/OprP
VKARTTVLAAALLAACAAAHAEPQSDGFTLDWRGQVQHDAAAVEAKLPPGARIASGGSFRRLRLGISGQFSRNWHYDLTPKFEVASLHRLPINTAFVQYDGWAPLHLRIGAFGPSADFEDSTSSSDITFLERPQPVDIARNIGGGGGRMALSALFYDDSYFATLSLTGGNINDTLLRQQALIARFAWRIAGDGENNLVIGADTTRMLAMPDFGTPPSVRFRPRPEINVLTFDTRLIDTGRIAANGESEWGTEVAGNWGSLYGQGGFFRFVLNRPGLSDAAFDGWYAQASWMLTGEARRWRGDRGAYGGTEPAHPLFGGDGFGAFEIAARYSRLDLDDHPGMAGAPAPAGGIRGGKQWITTIGLNWYPGGDVRFLLDYQHTDVARLSAGGGPLGARLDTVSLRSQFTF